MYVFEGILKCTETVLLKYLWLLEQYYALSLCPKPHEDSLFNSCTENNSFSRLVRVPPDDLALKGIRQ